MWFSHVQFLLQTVSGHLKAPLTSVNLYCMYSIRFNFIISGFIKHITKQDDELESYGPLNDGTVSDFQSWSSAV